MFLLFFISINLDIWSKPFYVNLRQITELVKNIFYRILFWITQFDVNLSKIIIFYVKQFLNHTPVYTYSNQNVNLFDEKKSQKRTIFDSCAHTKSASKNQTKQEIQKLVNMIETNIQKEAQNSAGIRNQVGLWRLQNLSQLGVLLVKVSILMSPIINSKLFSKKKVILPFELGQSPIL